MEVRDQAPAQLLGARELTPPGAGAAGSTAAHNLRKYAEEASISVNITIFEKSSFIGGRSTTVDAWNDPSLGLPIELGASIFVKANEILVNATEEFGLSTDAPDDNDMRDLLGIWDGEKFVYTQSQRSSKWWDITKLLWKYGYSVIRANNLMKATVGKFMNMYKAPYFPFRSLSETAQRLDLHRSTGLTGAQLLRENKIYAPFTADIIQAATRVNYGQNLGIIHGLETMVCLAVEGAMQIDGGNWQIFEHMALASNATILLDTAVSSIERGSARKYALNSKSLVPNPARRTTPTQEFDSIVLAAPLQFSNIKLGIDVVKKIPDEIPYVKLHVTLFASPNTLSGKYFGLKEGAEVPDVVLTTTPPDQDTSDENDIVGKAGFFSISTLRYAVFAPGNDARDGPQNIYKIFSPAPITADQLSSLFNIERSTLPDNLNDLVEKPTAQVSWFYPKVWYSYPYEYPRVTFERIELADGFYYTSGMESFISTMETNALMGKNVARLIVDDYVLEKEGFSQTETEEQTVIGVQELKI